MDGGTLEMSRLGLMSLPFGNALAARRNLRRKGGKSSEAVQGSQRVHRPTSGVVRGKRHQARAEEEC